MKRPTFGLYDPAREHSACGVGFITRLDGAPSHDVIRKGDEALRAIPHRGGTSAEGVGDGGGVSVDLSVEFFAAITGEELRAGHFGVANCFVPTDAEATNATDAADATYAARDAGRRRDAAVELVGRSIAEQGFDVLLVRDVPVDHSVARPAAERHQLPIVQWVFRAPADWTRADVDTAANRALLAVEAVAYADDTDRYAGLYVLSLSAGTQVLKGRLNSGEVIGYFRDLGDPRHSVRSLYFHTRFSTNTEPHPTMAQPFRLMAHNGELNTDRKNRLSDEALARARTRSIVRPPGQSDSSRLDQTLQSRVFDDGLDLVEAVVSLMPPAWENDRTLPDAVRDMLSEGDRLLSGLAGTVDAGASAAGPPVVPDVPEWESGDQLAQLDAVLADGGAARREAFHRYRGEHRPIEVDVVPAVLDHVCSVGLPIGVAVFAPAAMQACGGRVHVTDRTVGGRVFAAVAESSVEIDLAGVRACHLVRSTAAHGPTSALELDDEDGRCVAVITQFGMVGEDVHAAWEHLAASLPDA
ncbi:hypothetical protein ACWD4T_12690 [Streptomyces umbrinus]